VPGEIQCFLYLAEILAVVGDTEPKGTFALAHAMKLYRGVETCLDLLVTCALTQGEQSPNHPDRFTTAERFPGIQEAGWVPRASLDVSENRYTRRRHWESNRIAHSVASS
jgi:hypothetical protein